MTLIPSNEAEEFMKDLKAFDPMKTNELDWDDDKYFADKEYISNSMLKKLRNDGPQHLKAYLQYGQEEKDSFKFGSAFHCLILEPDMFEARYFAIDDTEICEEIGGKRPTATKKYKEWLNEIMINNANRTLLSMDEMNTLIAMQDKLMSVPNVVQLLKDTKREVVYTTEIHGVKVKCKTDSIKPTKYIADIKTMSDPVTEQNVIKAIRKYGYDQQGAFYTDICNVEKFYFICIEKKYPYSIGIFELGEESYKAGKFKYMESLELYKYHFQQNPNKIDDYFIQGII